MVESFDNLSLEEIAESFATKPKLAAEMFIKCMDDKHTYKGNWQSAEELIKLKNAKIADLNREIARYRCDLEQCQKTKILPGEQDLRNQLKVANQQIERMLRERRVYA